MPNCFYCGSNSHEVYGCPTRAVKSIGTLLKDQGKRASADSSRIYSQLERIAFESGATTQAIHDLTDTLSLEFAELRVQLDTLIGIALRPIAVAARDHYNIGYACLGKCRLDKAMAAEAIRKLEEAREADPSFYGTYLALGFAYVETDKLEQAKDSFHLAWVNAETKLQQAQSLVFEGRCSSVLGDQPQALARYDQALSLLPKLAEAHYFSATAIALQGLAGSGSMTRTLIEHIRSAIDIYALFHAKARSDQEFTSVRADVDLILNEMHQERKAILRSSQNDLSAAMNDLRKRDADRLIGRSFSDAYELVQSLADHSSDTYVTTVQKIKELKRFEATW